MQEEEVARFFASEIPEVASGVVEIKSIARIPKYRTKVALISHDPEVDCVAACVGMRGCRIKKVIEHMDGERIDVLRWYDSPESLIPEALQPAAIENVALQPERRRAVVTVREDQFTLAMGLRNENRDLASLLCGWVIEIGTAANLSN